MACGYVIIVFYVQLFVHLSVRMVVCVQLTTLVSVLQYGQVKAVKMVCDLEPVSCTYIIIENLQLTMIDKNEYAPK